MALLQNLLEFTSGYSFCDINRVFACQNRAKLWLKGQISAGNGSSKPKTGQEQLLWSALPKIRSPVSKKVATHTISSR
jgi:hypothetical protein